MNVEPTSPPHIDITGDTLALDQRVRAQVLEEATRLQGRRPEEHLGLRIRIMEELDRVHGHRTRCEIVVSLRDRRQVVVREARKQSHEAIAQAFGTVQRQLRRLRHRTFERPPLAANEA
ncbi:MAG: HPF/RaiA family ribosome-associated protein [Chromatiaceae bacterium]|jgi:ribosome-associated translation inhibitor RaiA